MKKIVYLTNTRFPTEKAHGLQICKTCEAFADHGIEVILVHPYRKLSKTGAHKKDPLTYYGLKTDFKITQLYNPDIFRIQNLLPKWGFPFFYVLHAFLWSLFAVWTSRHEKADLYYTRDISIALWLSLFSLPAVFEAHAAPGRLQRILLPFISNRSEFKAVILMAAFLKPLYEQHGISPDKIILSHHGFSPEAFADIPDKHACRKRLGLPPEKKIIGYIGRFKSVDNDKGITDLIKMISFLNTDESLLLLCVGGPLSAVPDYLLYAEQHRVSGQQLSFIDHVPNPEVPFWISACDAVLLPLTSSFMKTVGALPLKLFEYMASGVPIVAADLPSIREFLVHEKNAVLVEADNPSALADGVKKIISDPEIGSRLSSQAQKDVAQYTWKYRVIKLLKELTPDI